MPRHYSMMSAYYVIPEFEGRTVRERVELLERTLPVPTTVEEAVERAENGFYALCESWDGCIEALWERQKFSGKTPLKFWSEVAADNESHFQGNIGPVLAKKLHRITEEAQRAQLRWLQDDARSAAKRCGYNTDNVFFVGAEPFAGLEEQIKGLKGIVERLQRRAAEALG
jgi:hypothetical protein